MKRGPSKLRDLRASGDPVIARAAGLLDAVELPQPSAKRMRRVRRRVEDAEGGAFAFAYAYARRLAALPAVVLISIGGVAAAAMWVGGRALRVDAVEIRAPEETEVARLRPKDQLDPRISAPVEPELEQPAVEGHALRWPFGHARGARELDSAARKTGARPSGQLAGPAAASPKGSAANAFAGELAGPAAPSGANAGDIAASLPDAPSTNARRVPSADGAEMVALAAERLRRSHDPKSALALLTEYRRLHRDGMLAEEALALSIEAADRARDPIARGLALEYLRRYPAGRFTDLARAIGEAD